MNFCVINIKLYNSVGQLDENTGSSVWFIIAVSVFGDQ